MEGDEGRQRALSILFFNEKRIMYAKMMKMGRNVLIASIDLTLK